MIGRNTLVPFLKNNDYPGGIQSLIFNLMAQIQSSENLRAVKKPWFEELPLYPESGLGIMTLFFASLLLMVILYFGLGKNIRSRFIVIVIGIAMGIVETQCIASLPRYKRICHIGQFPQCQIIGM